MISKIFDKKYDEAFAALVLFEMNIIKDKPFSQDWLSDKPDLQIDGFGVEVSQAITKDEGKQRKFNIQLLECNNYEEAKELSNSRYFRDSESEVEKWGSTDFPAIHSPVKIGIPSDWTDIIIDSIKVKNEKFQTYTNHNDYSKKGLFLYCKDNMLLLFHGEDHFTRIQNELGSTLFDVIYLLFPSNDFIVIDESTIERLVLDNIASGEIMLKAMEILHGIDSCEYRECKEINEAREALITRSQNKQYLQTPVFSCNYKGRVSNGRLVQSVTTATQWQISTRQGSCGYKYAPRRPRTDVPS